jgi:hypothetical protein
MPAIVGRGCLLAILAIAFTVPVWGVSSASASAPPSLEFNYDIEYPGDPAEVFATRMVARAEIRLAEIPTPTKWRAEYSTSKTALEGGAGEIAGSGEVTTEENIFFGPADPLEVGRHVLHHLVPDTHYYARFIAEDLAGPQTLPFEFTTLPVAKPDVSTNPNDVSLTTLGLESISPTTAAFKVQIESNGAETKYGFGYSTSPSGPFTSCASGSISVAEDFAEPAFHCSGLSPETIYYVKLVASNEKGTTEQATFKPLLEGYSEVSTFETPTAKPYVFQPAFRNVTATSARVQASVVPHHEETHWRFESATSLLGPWLPVPGATGTISQSEAEALSEGEGPHVEGSITGLNDATNYYVRLFAEDADGEAQNSFGEPVVSETRGIGGFQTVGPPSATTLAVHAFEGEALRIVGSVDANDTPTSAEQTITIQGNPTGGTFTLAFKGQSTAPIVFDAPADVVNKELGDLPGLEGKENIIVNGPDGGPYVVIFLGGDREMEEPPITADASSLTPSGSVDVAVTQRGGESYDTHYRFQYIAQNAFEVEGGFSGPAVKETPEVGVDPSTETQFIGADLSDVTTGETYRYRLAATSTLPGNPVVYGAEHTLVVAATPAPEPVSSCPNDRLRVGASANLPDCRGYEQLTPVFKEGAREPFSYGVGTGGGFTFSEDGDTALLESEAVNWGAGAGTGQSPYLFSREANGTWRMTAESKQPETGVNDPFIQLLAPDLSRLAFYSSFHTSPEVASKEVEFKVGPIDGPYTTAATVSQGDVGLGWVAASKDSSKVFLQTQDSSLLGTSTGTARGREDIYEYAEGELRQVNVTGADPGSTIGTCGAGIVKGDEQAGSVSSVHAVSADGSRVFFTAVPGSDCSQQSHLYMRVDGESTVDIGSYRFLAANAEGRQLLLEKASGETHEVLLYEAASASYKSLFSVHGQVTFLVSEDLSTIYFDSSEQLTPEAPPTLPSEETSIYRYDVPAGKLSFIDMGFKLSLASTSPDGRYLYLGAENIGGIPGGRETQALNGSASQVYRYDSSESLLQCASCASPYDPEPKLISVFGQTGGTGGMLQSRTGEPTGLSASSNGDYLFFQTASALLPSDVDGEVAPEAGKSSENRSPYFSPSSDVYEWRKPGVNGCAHPQGCVALITDGRGGFLNLFVGTDPTGQDAFIYTSSRLLPQDKDTAGDIYDARIDGGAPPPAPRPVECEGDACSTPANPPNDATPSSLTVSGEGNVVQPSVTRSAVKLKKPKKKPKSKRRVKTKRRRNAKGRRSTHRTVVKSSRKGK